MQHAMELIWEKQQLLLFYHQIKNKLRIKLTGGAVSNDANHISGPSRSGQELCMPSIKQ